MNDLQGKFQQALSLHSQGQLPRAQALFEEIIARRPKHAGALSVLGLIAGQTGNFARAAQLLGRAVEVDPGNAGAHNNRGLALHELGQWESALKSFNQALRLKPGYVMAYYNRANTQIRLKRWEEALGSYDRAIAMDPRNALAYVNRGNVLVEMRRWEAALDSYDQAIAIQPTYVDAYLNRGNVQGELGRWEAALESYDQAIALRPDYAEAFFNRGNAQKAMKRWDDALESYEQAIACNARFFKAHFNKGVVLQELRQLEAALASYQQSVAIEPDHAEAHSNLGNVLRELNQWEAALASYERSIEIKPDYAEAHTNRAIVRLLLGDFERGWRDYEWRWRHADTSTLADQREFSEPRWLGEEALAGKSILVHNEQGFGDVLQFCRYAKLLTEKGARVILEVPKPLLTLLANLDGVSQLVARGSGLPQFDYQCPLLSLPLAFGTRLTTIPASVPYLRADAAKVAEWQVKLGEKGRPRIGLAWSGSLAVKSIPLEQLIQHLPEGFQYVSLQKEVREADRPVLRSTGAIADFAQDLHDFNDTAALCECMDLVISVDTSVAHLSGALGKPAWILLMFSPDWRWLLDRDDSPWYPTAKLYRQDTPGEWAGAISRVAADLKRSFPCAH